ncbi:MAG: SDR family oxidoreductase [Myxococcales bacterium]|nr:SDR family oxidoreductase [Myxococcales bacterium]
MGSSNGSNVLVTGYPAFTAKRMCRRLTEAGDTVFALVQPRFAEEANIWLRSLGGRFEILEGDVVDIDLGLSGQEVRTLTQTIEVVHHMAAIYFLGVDTETIRQVNVEGTKAVLRLSLEMAKLRRFCQYSTAFVAGNRTGVVQEDELDCGQRFRNVYEQTKFVAETVVRHAMRDLPLTVFRPSLIVGDSTSGEIDRFAGPYYLMNAIVNLPIDIHLPLPGKGDNPLNLVPIDFVIDAAHYLSSQDRAVGRTFHLTDSNPLPARRVYELVAEHAGRKLPKGQIPASITQLLLRIPGLERVTRPPRQFLEQFNQQALFNNSNTLQLLAGSGIVCPPFESYVGRLVSFLRQHTYDAP